MITIFSTPKDFYGEFEIIQKNALSSWRAISKDIEIMILGDSKGAKEAAEAINAKYIAQIPVSDNGTPTIPGLFETAEKNGTNNIYCFINSDIILAPDFITAIKRINIHMNKFLAVGYRFNIDVKSFIDFTTLSESKLFFSKAQTEAVQEISSAIDMFCFTRGVFKNIPKFTVGRSGFDNWLIWKARRTFVPVIDITCSTKIFHQNHSYNFKGFTNHHDVLNSQETIDNQRLLGNSALNLNDSNWILDLGKVYKKNDEKFKQRNLGKLSILYPEFSIILIIYKKFYRRISNLFKSKTH